MIDRDIEMIHDLSCVLSSRDEVIVIVELLLRQIISAASRLLILFQLHDMLDQHLIQILSTDLA